MPAGVAVGQCQGLADLAIPNGSEPSRFCRLNVVLQIGTNRVKEEEVDEAIHDLFPSNSFAFELV